MSSPAEIFVHYIKMGVGNLSWDSQQEIADAVEAIIKEAVYRACNEMKPKEKIILPSVSFWDYVERGDSFVQLLEDASQGDLVDVMKPLRVTESEFEDYFQWLFSKGHYNMFVLGHSTYDVDWTEYLQITLKPTEANVKQWRSTHEEAEE